MPQIDYVVLAEYVRQDQGVTHIMGAGIDTFGVPSHALPAAVPVGLAVRVTFDSRDEAGAPHELQVDYTGEDEQGLLTARQTFLAPAHPLGIPEHWRIGVSIIIRTALPIPVHGNYALTVTLDDDPERTRRIDLRAIDPQPGQP